MEIWTEREVPDAAPPLVVVIPQELMLERLAKSEEMREFFIQFWLANPVFAKQAGAHVASLLAAAPIQAIEQGGAGKHS